MIINDHINQQCAKKGTKKNQQEGSSHTYAFGFGEDGEERVEGKKGRRDGGSLTLNFKKNDLPKLNETWTLQYILYLCLKLKKIFVDKLLAWHTLGLTPQPWIL